MSAAIEIPCIQRSSGELEVDPSVCLNLNDENTAENRVIIPSYESVRNAISFDILSQTSLTRVPRFILPKFPKLRQLRMMNTGITTLTPESFRLGAHLELIDLRNNQIGDIPAKVFAHLNRLTDVNLAYNKIARIESGAFDDVHSLKIMILSNNQVQTIKSGTFVGAENLRELYLESNNIRSIESGAFNLANLEIVSLKDNRLASLPDAIFENATKLEKIDLSNNDLKEVSEVLTNCLNVYSLSLSDNPELKDADLFNLTKKLPELSYLFLGNTGFKLNEDGARNEESPNVSLTHLDLSTNNLNSPDIFLRLTHFRSLKTVILNNNAFTHLNDVSDLKRLFPRLNSIQLKHNRLLDQNWIQQAQAILKTQRIRLITDQP